MSGTGYVYLVTIHRNALPPANKCGPRTYGQQHDTALNPRNSQLTFSSVTPVYTATIPLLLLFLLLQVSRFSPRISNCAATPAEFNFLFPLMFSASFRAFSNCLIRAVGQHHRSPPFFRLLIRSRTGIAYHEIRQK